ncbi:MAG TPA: amidohydrolase family protein [Gemmatimonadaceae bacterium]|nr:amidohydrolase family protein [Gemmatimonadaceae bacterium]
MSSPDRDVPLAGAEPLIEVHAHFLHARCGRKDWQERNASRLRAGDRIGVTVHVASILGTWGHTSPIYFPSPADVTLGNDEMLALQKRESGRVRSYVTVNPNDTEHSLREIERCLAQGAIGIKLAASRRADDPLLDAIAEEAARRGVPVLQHVWQHRRRDWPGQEASDGVELARLAARHPDASFILAHIGGGGDWQHTLPALAEVPNVYVDLSGSGVDRGMLDRTLTAVGASRMVWGSDLTMETGLAKLWALDVIGLSADEMASIRWRNAARIFPRNSFPMLAVSASTVGAR